MFGTVGRFFHTLHLKMLIAFLAVALIPLGIIVTLNYRASTAALTEAAYRSLYAAASQAAVAVDSFITSNLDDIASNAKLPELAEYLEMPAEKRDRTSEKERILKTLAAISGKSRKFPVSYALLDLNGRNIADTEISNIGKMLSNRSYFSQALKTGLPYCSPIEFSSDSGKVYLYFSSRILNETGKPVGVLRSKYHAEVLQTLLSGTTGLLGTDSMVILLDENYLRLAHGSSSDLIYKTVVPLSAERISQLQALRRLPLLPPEQLSTDLPLLAKGLQKAGSREPYFSAPILATGMKMNAGAVAKMNSMPWLVAFMQSQDVFLKPVKAQTTKTIYFAVVIIIAVALLAVGISELLSEPISKLTAAARRVADGDLTAQAFVKSHDEIGALANAFNIMTTRLKKRDESLAEEKERLAVTLRSIGDGVITTDMNGKVLLINNVAEYLTGWTQEEARGRPLAEIFNIIDYNTREASESPFDTVMRTGTIVDLADHVRLVARDGREMTITDSGAPIRDRESRVVGVVLVFRDVTEKEKAEEELLKSEKLESLGILAGGIAHDFNNILTSIIGNISLARMYSPEDGKALKRLEDAEKAALRAKDLTQQLLTFSKGGAPIKGITSIAEVIKDSAHFALRGSNVRYNFHMAPDLRTVEVDEGQISQVIHNMIINADQAMPQGGSIDIECENADITEADHMPLSSGKYIKISIRDHGIGIPRENLAKIFDPYYTTKKKGTGLGLTTSYSIIKRHDGHIAVDSEPGAGTTFTIYLPASEKEEPKSKRECSEDLCKGKGRILLMDDEEFIREVAGEMLHYLGYDVEFAKDGEETIALYTNAIESGRSFDAVIMDLTIPGGMGGRDAIRKLLEIDPKVKAIVSSGYSNDPIMADYRAYGFCGVAIKPYKANELGNVIHSALQKT